MKELEATPANRANRIVYVLVLWLLPGIFLLFAGLGSLWILSDRVGTPLWLEVALKYEACMPVLYVVFGVWALLLSLSPEGRDRESYERKRLALMWLVPLFLLASQIVITIISWDP